MTSEKCTQIGPNCPADGSSLSYPPNEAASIAFAVIFATSLALHLGLGWKTRTWSFLVAFSLGSSSEVVGYIGRAMLNKNPYNLSTFLLQIICLTTGPAFYSAGLYLCLARIVIIYGESISRISPIWYTRIFITCDVISLSFQGGGGGVAASSTTPSTLSTGNNLMLVGLIFQIITLVLFAVLCAEFFWRVGKFPSRKNVAFKKIRESRRFQTFLAAALVTFVTIFVRCVYRVVELSGGWNNKLQREEIPYIILESSMISVAALALAVSHPGYAFHTFNYLYSSVDGQKEDDVHMQSVTSPFLPSRQQ